MKKFIRTNWITGLYLIILLVGALIPLGMGTTLNNNYTFHVRADYLLHALFYIPLPVFMLLSRWGRRGGWIPVIILCLLAVVLFETAQLFLPYRTFNINDLIANGVGVMIGLVLFSVLGSRLLRITACEG